MKKTRWIIKILFLIVILCGAAAFIIVRSKQRERPIPNVVFIQNSTREDCIYICSNGAIYAAMSEEAFITPISELDEKIQQNNYEDILELVGTTDPQKVRKMYSLFLSVVVNDRYRLRPISNEIPNGSTSVAAANNYENKKQYWTGIYYNDEGCLTTRGIYESRSDLICSDKRAYKIVQWIYDCLKEYTR